MAQISACLNVQIVCQMPLARGIDYRVFVLSAVHQPLFSVPAVDQDWQAADADPVLVSIFEALDQNVIVARGAALHARRLILIVSHGFSFPGLFLFRFVLPQ